MKLTPLPSVVVALSICHSAFAWRGHTWEEWREVTGAVKPAAQSPQAGSADLIDLLQTAGPGSPTITTTREWMLRQARICNILGVFLGHPGDLATAAPEAVVLGETTEADHVRRHLWIRTEPDDWIPAYLLIPKNMPAGPQPAIICLHQTVNQGKDEPAGIQGDPSMFTARELVARGNLCLVPDVIGFGERLPEGATRAGPPRDAASRSAAPTRPAAGDDKRQPYDNIREFFRRHPRWSVMGKMNWDVSRCIDYLSTLPQVDRRRIGCIGHSHGAYGTIFAAAFDLRIRCAAASCGFTTLRSDPKPERWSHLTPLIPMIGFYMPDAKDVPFDWHEICSLIAPRAFLNWATLNDSIFPKTDNLTWVFGQLGQVYGLYGAKDRLAWKLAPGEHRFPTEARQWAYQWMEEQLRRPVEPTTRQRPARER